MLKSLSKGSASTLAVAGGLFVAGQPAFAQGESQVQETAEVIMVTARKKEESLLEVPVAITAFTAEDIEDRGLSDVRDIASRSPSFQYAENAGLAGGGRYNPNLTFRGMQNLTPVPQDQTASAFLDGVLLTGGPQAVSTIDIERVEVLKGPQSTYFGKGTFGGAVNFISKTPGNDFNTEIAAELATYETYRVAFSNEGPLIRDKLFYRVSLSGDQEGPMYRSSTDGGPLGEESTLQGALTLYATPSDNTSIKLRLSAQQIEDSAPQTTLIKGQTYAIGDCTGFTYPAHDRDGNPITATVEIDNYFCTAPVPSLGDLGEGILSANTSFNSPFYSENPNFSEVPFLAANGFTLRDVLVNNIQNDPYLADAPRLDHFGLLRRDYRASLQVDHEFENGVSVQANAAYSRAKAGKIFDYDNTGAEAGYVAAPLDYEDYFAEIRATSDQSQRLRWLIGASYYNGTIGYDFIGTTRIRVHLSDAVGIATRYTRAETYGAFAAVEFDITDRLGIAAETRYQIDQEEIVLTGEKTPQFKEWAPRFIIMFDPIDDLHIYASYSIGILPGRNNIGFRTADPFVQQQLREVFGDLQEVAPSDKLKNWEVGVKQRVFDGRLQYALTGYMATWENKKVTAAPLVQTDPNDPNSLNFAPNIIVPGEIDLWGVEFEGNAQLTDYWNVNVAAAYNKTENVLVFNESQSYFGTSNFLGKEEPRNPKWSFSVLSGYQAPLNSDWDWFARGEYFYKGGWYADSANIGRLNSRGEASLRLGVESDDKSFEFYVTNLLDNKDWTEGQIIADIAVAPGDAQFPIQRGILAHAPDKRQFGVRARFEF